MKQRVKAFFLWILVFYCIYVIGTALFILLFHTPIAKSIHVLMYRGVILLIIAGIISVLLLFLVRKFVYKRLDIKDVLMMSFAICCINMVLFTLIPVTVERSVSVFMLSYMADHEEQGFSESEIEEVFQDKYVQQYGAFEKRFYEQKITGDIYDTGDGYRITKQGIHMVEMFRLIGKLFDTDQRLLFSD